MLSLRLLLLSVVFSSFRVDAAPSKKSGQPFLINVNNSTAIIGNDLWNVTLGPQYGTKLFYKGADRVGRAVGHYVSYNGAASDLNLTNGRLFRQHGEYTDFVFSAREGDFHWVLTPSLAGAYQYFVNRALPVLGEFRSLWRLDNVSFPNGYTSERDQKFPALAEIQAANKTQDETWQRADGSYITKYDFSTFLPTLEEEVSVWGVHGEEVGSWYIHGGKDYFNGDQLKQELLVHRESSTGDAVQLNMLHGTHFQAVSNDSFAVGKTWGPWLWYLNDGSPTDALARAKTENKAWPYSWYTDSTGYNARGALSGRLFLSDGRQAAGAAVFLGDNNSRQPTLEQGANYYYRTYADNQGRFSFADVRTGSWGLRAWANGGKIGDVTGQFGVYDVVVAQGKTTNLGRLEWKTSGRKQVWQVGSVDRKATDFAASGPPHEHARADRCPPNLTYTVGESETGDWCFAQTKLGSWDIAFSLPSLPASNSSAAILSASLAGWSSGSSITVLANGFKVGNLSSIASDPSVYRSGTLAGEWHLFEFPVASGVLKTGDNKVSFNVTKSTALRGAIWDSVVLEWV